MYCVDSGFKMPPEWARHRYTIMEWPVEEAIWPGPFEEILQAYTDIVKKISEFEKVLLIARPELKKQAAQYCGPVAEIIEMEHNDSWARDNGPMFIINDQGGIAGINWIFNAWGNKYECALDNLVASRLLEKLKILCVDVPVVLEGGSIHVDGEGTLLTTEECLLNKNRNPKLGRQEVEDMLKKYLNIKKIIWLRRGLYGDDTDGHVDNVACFAKPGVILIQTCTDPEDPNYEISRENIEMLKSSRDAAGRSFDIIQIEQPPAVFYEGTRLTLSYLNFYFVNGGIILPVFGEECSQTDRKAVKVLNEVFPERKIATVNGRIVARGGGNVHCLTQQMPEVI